MSPLIEKFNKKLIEDEIHNRILQWGNESIARMIYTDFIIYESGGNMRISYNISGIPSDMVISDYKLKLYEFIKEGREKLLCEILTEQRDQSLNKILG